MGFRTKLDYSDNRQIKQRERSFTNLSGGTVFGVPFSALTTGVDPSNSAVTETYTTVVSTFSGNATTTNFTWYDPRMDIANSSISAITSSNSGITQNTGNVFVVSSTGTTADGYNINLEYTGTTFDLAVNSMFSGAGPVYSGTVTHNEVDFLSAGTLDYKDRTIWIDNPEITRTNRLIVTNNPSVGYVLTCDSVEGEATWSPVSAATSGATFWEEDGTGNTALKDDKGGHIINGVSDNSIIAGGSGNTIGDSLYSFIGGGEGNSMDDSDYSAIIAGQSNIIEDNSHRSVIAGGQNNTITSGHTDAFIGGGTGNTIHFGAGGVGEAIVGSEDSSLTGTSRAFIGGSYNSYIARGHTNAIVASSNSNIDNEAIDPDDARYNFIASSVYSEISGSTGGGNEAFLNTIIGGNLAKIYRGEGNTIIGSATLKGILDSNNSIIGGASANIINSGFAIALGSNTDISGSTYASVIATKSSTLSGVSVGAMVGTYLSNLSGASNSVIIGGNNNIMSQSDDSSIVGGDSNIIDDSYRSVILGGLQNTISGHTDAAILAGTGNTISDGYGEVIIGGKDNIITNAGTIQPNFSVIIGGDGCVITGTTNSVISGGRNNGIDSSGLIESYEFMGGGQSNSITGSISAAIIGGDSNSIQTSLNSFIGGGTGNTIWTPNRASSMIGCEDTILIGGASEFPFAIGSYSGYSDNVKYGGFIGGQENTIRLSENTVIIGGHSNTISNTNPFRHYNSAIIGGSGNTLPTGADYKNIVILGGQDITATDDDTVYMNNLYVTQPGEGNFYSDLDDSVGARVVLSGKTSDLIRYDITTSASDGFGFGMRGSTEASSPGYGNQGDGYIYSSVNNNGLNLISAPGVGTGDYIRFYAGQDAAGTTADMFIQGTGTTRGYVGIATESPTEELDINGELRIRTVGAGPGTTDLGVDATGVVVDQASDVNLKENIKTIENALDKVLNLRGVTYNWKDRERGGDDLRIGFIAQEVNEVEPILAYEGKSGFMGVHYKDFPALIVEAIKELANGNTPLTKKEELIFETQTIASEDNNIELNYGGTHESSLDGGLTVVKGIDENNDATLMIDSFGDWTTNTHLKPNGLVIPEFTPTSSNDNNGKIGEVTRDDEYLYIKTKNGWRRTGLETF